MARITVNIDDELLERALALSEGRTKNDVIEEALRRKLGNFELGLTHEELRQMREDE